MKTARTSADRASALHHIPSLLDERFRAAVRRNSRFSLRSFAKQLGIDHSTLSQVLKRKRPLSARDLKAVATRLGLSEEIIRDYESARRRKAGTGVQSPKIRSYSFDLDTFQFLSVWYHSAILELIHVRGFKPDSRWFANTLGIAVHDVNIALQRLLRLGLLEMSGRDRWTDKSGDAEFHSAALAETVANHINQEVHELAIAAIQQIPTELRVHRQMLVALGSQQLPRLKALADEFMEALRSLASEAAEKDDVYQLEFSFFPVTTLKKNGGNKNG